jgi:arylsulfatase A-like enzyme
MVQEMKQFISEKSSQPFFTYWAINMPHYPYQGDPKWLDYYADLESPRKEYAAFVSTIDEMVGEIYHHLKAIGELENTIIVYQSDHGYSVEERAFFGGGDAGALNGAKFSMLEGGIRVPAIIRYPSVLPKNEARHHWANSIDWMPTLADLIDIKIPGSQKIDGKSLLPLILDAKIPSPHKTMFWGTGNPENKKHAWAVRKGPWKLLGNPSDPTGKLTFTETDKLYLTNIEMDSTEHQNLGQQYPEKVEELSKMYENWINIIKSEKL